MRKLWKHQQYAVDKYKDRKYFGLLFSCGLGKTATAIALAEAKGLPVLIIAPSALCSQWYNEVLSPENTTKKWLVALCTSKTRSKKQFLEDFEALKSCKEAGTVKALIVSLESFQKSETVGKKKVPKVPSEVTSYIASCIQEPFIILDESSKIKTNEPCKMEKRSLRTQAIMQLNNVGERCILTGTFMSKSPVNAYDQMNFLKNDFFGTDIYSFARKHTIRRSLKDRRGATCLINEADYYKIHTRLVRFWNDAVARSRVIDSVCSFYGISYDDCKHIYEHEAYTPFKNVDTIWEEIGDVCFKVERQDVLDLPPKLYQTVPIKLTTEQLKLYEQLFSMHCTDNVVVDNGLKLYLRFQDICNGYEPIDTNVTFDEAGRQHSDVILRPLNTNPKLDMLEEICDEIDGQAVVWCSRTQLLNDAAERLREKGFTVGIYDGKVTKEKREADYKAFEEGKLQFIVINQASGAYGLDGLKKADYAIYLSNSYSVEQRVQSEDRIYRGQVTNCKHIIDLTCKGTCEDRVTEALKQGKELLNTGTTDVSLFEYKE